MSEMGVAGFLATISEGRKIVSPAHLPARIDSYHSGARLSRHAVRPFLTPGSGQGRTGLRPRKGDRGSAAPAPAPLPLASYPAPILTVSGRTTRRERATPGAISLPLRVRNLPEGRKGLTRSGKGPTQGYATGAVNPA